MESGYTQINLYRIFYQTEIKMYLPFSDWFGTKQTSSWFQINGKIINTIWFRFDKRFLWLHYKILKIFLCVQDYVFKQYPTGKICYHAALHIILRKCVLFLSIIKSFELHLISSRGVAGKSHLKNIIIYIFPCLISRLYSNNII